MSTSINIIGGEGKIIRTVEELEKLDEWFNSLNIDNYGIVAFEDNRYLWNFFSSENKSKFSEYGEALKEILDNNKGKYDLIRNLAINHPGEGKKGDGNVQNVIFDGEWGYPYVQSKNFRKEKDDNWPGTRFTTEGNLERSTYQKIVGYVLKACNPKGDQISDYVVNYDPILRKDSSYSFYFQNLGWESRVCWDITIYYVDLQNN